MSKNKTPTAIHPLRRDRARRVLTSVAATRELEAGQTRLADLLAAHGVRPRLIVLLGSLPATAAELTTGADGLNVALGRVDTAQIESIIRSEGELAELGEDFELTGHTVHTALIAPPEGQDGPMLHLMWGPGIDVITDAEQLLDRTDHPQHRVGILLDPTRPRTYGTVIDRHRQSWTGGNEIVTTTAARVTAAAARGLHVNPELLTIAAGLAPDATLALTPNSEIFVRENGTYALRAEQPRCVPAPAEYDAASD